MKNLLLSMLSLLLFFGVANAKGQYENQEFSIATLQGTKEAKIRQPLIMFLTPSEGFSPNVNVQIQKFAKSLKEYVELSTKQFKQANFKIIQNKMVNNHVIFEYAGSMNGSRKLHWYAMVYKKGESIFLITATATQSQWKNQSKALISCVESFKLK